MLSWDIAVSYFREDAELGGRLVAALQERGVSVWVCEDLIPTGNEVAVEFDEPSKRFLALLMSEAALQTIAFNDAFFAVVEDDLEGIYPTLAPLRVGQVELSALPDLLKSLSPVALDQFNVEDVADRLAAIALPERAWEHISAVSTQRGVLFERYVESLLALLALPYRRHAAVSGLEVDFEVSTADGRQLIFETKAWAPGSDKRVAPAVRQLDRIAAATGVDDVYLVVPEGAHEYRAGRVLDEHGLLRLLSPLRWTSSFRAPETAGSEPPQKRIFAAMPFDERYDDTYFVAMVGAADTVGATCRRVDREDYNSDIVARIQTMIRESDAVIADLSEASPNVLYETGYAHALGIETVHICNTPLGELPFDVRNVNTISYAVGKTHQLRRDLEKRLHAIL